tara:strand:- start:315 stop:2132 length:1818 start_codon:yes stop_codon:yes gene_type:complete
MSDSLVHRGPDDEGLHLNEGGNLGLGFRRLSIIDLENGAQPMSTLCGKYTIVFNGEIYNYLKLKSLLINDGYKFSTNSDTEVLLKGYKRWGIDILKKIRGMFAFAIWDEQKNILFLARDRLGIKPLYFYNNDAFVFASEIKSILAYPFYNKEINEEALYHYLALSASPAPTTLFKKIHKLEPGHFLKVNKNGDIEKHCYWEPKVDNDIKKLSEIELKDKIIDLLKESIKLRTMSEVPFGAFLSGGVDSSLNVALMSEVVETKIKTFSVGIEGDRMYNELNNAEFVAKAFNTDHFSSTITKNEFIGSLNDIVKFQDEPLADPVSIPLFHVSKLARTNGTYVIQVGEGADEIFSGYGLYSLMNKFNKLYFKPYSSLPTFLKKIGISIGKNILSNSKQNYLRLAHDNKELFWGGAVVFNELEKEKLFNREKKYDTYSKIIDPFYRKYDKMNSNASFIDRIIALDLHHRLPELLLMRTDKMAMATSVETRVPFLDHKLVEFVLNIPSNFKIKNGIEKYILKESARNIIPDKIIDRQKVGFCGSASSMMFPELLNFAEDQLNNSKWIRDRFNLVFINKLIKLHRNGKVDSGNKIYSLLNLCLWHKHWFNS